MAKEDKDRDDLVTTGRKLFARAADRESDNRQRYIDDTRFARLGEQWPEAIEKQRALEGRPCLKINRLPAFIRQVVNDMRQNSPSIKFHPVGDGADVETAKILDGLVRNIEYTSNADVAYDNAGDNAVTGGFGYFRIITDYACDDSFEMDIKIEAIKNPLTVYGDPMCFDTDSQNWNEAFVTEMWSTEAFQRKWPNADISDFQTDGQDERSSHWFTNDEVRVAEWWRREEVQRTLLLLSNGEVMYQEQYDEIKELLDLDQITIKDQRQTKSYKVTQHIMSGNEILETNDWPGVYIPICPVYGDEVVIDGERHLLSLVHFAKDPQQMFNYWRSASTELVALAPKAPWVGAVGQFATDPGWATANTATHQYLEYDAVEVNGNPVPPPQRQPFAGVPAGALQEAMNASDDMKSVMGLFDASLGAQSNETSGRAILARQREGDVGTFNFTDNLSRAIRHAGRILCDLIPKVYSTARILRIIHEDGTNSNVAINGAQPPEMTPEEQAQMKAIPRVYNLTTGKYDVTCESGPSYTTRREEAATQIMEFIRVYPAAAPVIGDLLAKNMDWPGADEIADRLRKMLPPQLQGQSPEAKAAQQQIQQLTQALQQVQQKLQDTERDKSIDAAKVKVEEHKTQISAYDAETKRMQALGLQASPELAAALGLQVAQSALTAPDITPSAQDQAPPQSMPPAQPQPQPDMAPPEGMPQ